MDRSVALAVVIVGIPAWISAGRVVLGALGDVGKLPAWLAKYDQSRAVRMVLASDREAALAAVVEHAEALTELAQASAQILAEVKPNHGSSLRDAVNRVEQRLEEHSTYARDHDAKVLVRLDLIDERLEHGDAKFDELYASDADQDRRIDRIIND